MSEILETKYASSMVRVSSHDRNFNIKNESSSSFTVNVPSNTEQLKNVLAVQPLSVKLPNLFYNCYNSIFKFSINTVDYSISVPDGQYTIDSFMNEFVSAYNTATGNTMTYNSTSSATPDLDPITFKLDLDFASLSAITFTASADNNIAQKLGFSYDDTVYTSSATGVITSPYPVDLSGPDAVYIHSIQMSNGVHDMDTSGDIHVITAIPLDKPFGQTCFWQNSSASSHLIKFYSPRNITNISMNLRDNRGRLLDIQGADWTIILKVYYSTV